jgi:UrcA family protein
MLNLSIGRCALLASIFGVALAASSASAQDYDDSAPVYQSSSTEEVIVAAPRHRIERSAIGAPIRDVALSRPVRFDDLDLTTDEGAYVLRERVRYTAQRLCRDLDSRYPITVAEDGPSCYQQALDDAMDQAETAIEDARGND